MIIQISLVIIALALLSLTAVFLFMTLKIKSTIKLLESDLHNVAVSTSELIEQLSKITSTSLYSTSLETLISSFTKKPEKESRVIPDGIAWVINGISLFQKTREVLKNHAKQ